MSAAAPINATRKKRLRYAIRVRMGSCSEAWRVLSGIPELQSRIGFEEYSTRLESRAAICLIAEADWKTAGCVVGYPVDDRTFCSWLGGVLPEYRGCCIARTLLQESAYVLAERGYKEVEMKTAVSADNFHRLLASEGYERIGIETSRDGRMLLYAKRLSPQPIPILHPLCL